MKYKVGLFGFGRTGKLVANEIIQDEDLELVWVIRKSHNNIGEYASSLLGNKNIEGLIYSYDSIDFDTFYNENHVDVIIDFSSTSAVREYTNAVKYGTKIVSAISKYEEGDFELLIELSKIGAVLYSPNITLGINFVIVASKILKQLIPHVDIEVVEEHFREKKEASGTALKIADSLHINKETHVNSIRVGGIYGNHEVIFGLPNQIIRLKHETISRAAFGQGAIYGAKWILKKNKGLYNMEDIIYDTFAKNIMIVEKDSEE